MLSIARLLVGLLLSLLLCWANGGLVEPKVKTFDVVAGRFAIGIKRQPWFHSVAKCRAFDMELVTFPTQQRFHEFEEFLKKHAPYLVKRQSRFWVGAYYENNHWRWVDTGKKMSYKNWANEEPPNQKHDAEDICPRTTVSNWDVYSCDKAHYFVCQLPIDHLNEKHW